MNQIPQPDWAAKWAIYRPDQIALREYETDRVLSYRELNLRGDRLAHYLTDHYGITKGDRIAILAENSLEQVILFVAAQKTGCILVPLNYRLAGPEIDYLLRNAEPRLLVYASEFSDTLAAAPARADLPHEWDIAELATYCASSTTPTPPFPAVEPAADDPIFILYTSGTTGFPKGALYTHGMLFWNSVNTALSLIVTTESRTINCMPLFHTGGWNVLLTPFLHHGGYTVLLKKFDAATVLDLLQSERTTIFMGVPTMLKMMAELPAFAEARFPELHYVIVGGEAMPIPLIERWHERGVAIRQGYGMTEVGPNLTSLHQRDAIRKKGSIGRPNFYVEAKIIDPTGREAAPGDAGELLLRGPLVTPGYWRQPAATEKAIRDGWFHTGDRVRQDEEGYLYVVDRIKNMFISGGENVYPAEVERVLLEHPAVAEALVIGVPDDRWGEVGRAFVVRVVDTDIRRIVGKEQAAVAEDELLAFCRERLAQFKVPRYVTFLAGLPKNATGKIDRQALRARPEGPAID